MKKGIAVAGTILVDKINEISAYPAAGELTQIRSVQLSTGGMVPNVANDLKIMDAMLPVKAVGRIGADGDGAFARATMEKYGVDTAFLLVGEKPTSFSDVMSVSGGQRTFFTYAGANADFCAEDLDFAALDVDMLHLGYFLLLDKVDAGEGLKILKKAKAAGVETSIDLVSENSDRYGLVLPCLPFVDNLIINEVEAGRLTDIEPKRENLREIAEKLFSLGVQKRVVIHTPEVGICLSENGFFAVPSLVLPDDYIQGTTGAGDAFCAGFLLGIYYGWSEEESLVFAAGAAASSLAAADANGGVKSVAGIKELISKSERRKICL